MSLSSQEMITCPKCGHTSPFTVWQSINTMLDPEMKAAVRDFSAFTFVCPECGKRTLINYGFLYHQMEDRMMIYYADTDENAERIKSMLTQEKLPDMMKDIITENYLIRIVRSLNELREKLEIFDAGLDDRIIEIYKFFVWIKLLGKPIVEKIELLFEQIDQKNLIHIFADGKTFGSTEIDSSLYESIANDSGFQLPDIRKDVPVVDRKYAFRFFKFPENETD